jgi:hypothetical protein
MIDEQYDHHFDFGALDGSRSTSLYRQIEFSFLIINFDEIMTFYERCNIYTHIIVFARCGAL